MPLAFWDVHDVEAFARRVLDNRLSAWGAYLEPCDYDDAVAYLIVIAWQLSNRYDPSKGPSFSTYAYRILRLRVTDWYRARFGDSRRQHAPDSWLPGGMRAPGA